VAIEAGVLVILSRTLAEQSVLAVSFLPSERTHTHTYEGTWSHAPTLPFGRCKASTSRTHRQNEHDVGLVSKRGLWDRWR
jgi:hypothetical protein